MSKVDAIPEAGASHDDTHIEADFTDDEVDADVCRFYLIFVTFLFTFPRQVFDEELDGDRSVVEKTVNLSVADGEGYCFANDPFYDGS